MLNCISAAGGAVCAAGDDGAIHLHLPQAVPERHHLPGKPRLLAVAVHSPALVYAVGAGGAVWCWRRGWHRLQPFTTADLCAVAVAAPDDLILGAVDGRLWRTTGEARPVSVVSPDPGPVQAVRAVLASPGEIWTGGGSVIQRLQGARHAERWALAGLDVVALARGGGGVYAVGRGGVVARLQPGDNAPERIPAPGDLSGAACGPDGTLYAICSRKLLALGGDGWRCLFEAPGDLSGVACDSAGAVWLASARAVLRHLPDPCGVGDGNFSRTVSGGSSYVATGRIH